MAAVARGHGGDTGGDPPPSGNWQPPSGTCSSGGAKKKRGPSRNVAMRNVWKKNGKNALPIEFDDVKLNGTWKPVGENGDYFKSFVGNLIKLIPYRFPSWDKVPAELKTPIFPSIETYFDMRRHYQGPNSANIRLGIDKLCAERYKDKKSRFKEKWFEKRGGVMQSEQLRQSPPPDMTLDDWSLYMDFYCEDSVVHRSQANKEVRGHQVHQSLHGRQAYSQYRYQNRDPVTLEPPSLIAQYAHNHSRNGVFTHETLAENHRRMVIMRDAQVGSQQPLTERQILMEVLGERRGHVRGVGRTMGSSSSSATQSGAQSCPSTRLYTQAEVDAIIASQQSRFEKRLRANDKSTKAIYQALSREGIHVDPPSESDDEEPRDDENDN